MTLKILTEKQNNLFKRKEVKAVFTSEKSPSRADMLESLATHFGTSAEHVKIKRIKGKFGTNHFNIEANIYHSADEKNIVELKKKKETPKEKK